MPALLYGNFIGCTACTFPLNATYEIRALSTLASAVLAIKRKNTFL